MKNINHPERESDFVTGAFSDGVIVDNLLFVSGQASVDFKSSKFVLGTIEEETERTMNNIKIIVESAGASMQDIVKCTVYLKDINEFDRYNNVYSKYFPSVKPSRTTVETGLGKNIKIEIDCIARIPS